MQPEINAFDSEGGQSANENIDALPQKNNKKLNAVKFIIPPQKIALWLTLITLALNLLGVVGRGIEYLLGIKETTELVRLVHVAEEGNLTTWFSAMLLFISSFLLAFIAAANKKFGKTYIKHWGFLSLIFFLMSLDEAARIHEITIEPLRSLLNSSGIFHYAWVVLAIPLLLIFLLAYTKFISNLPKKSRMFFIISGTIYVVAAMGMDMVVGYFISNDSCPRLLEPALITVEELGENLGIILFIYGLLLHIKNHLQIMEIKICLT